VRSWSSGDGDAAYSDVATTPAVVVGLCPDPIVKCILCAAEADARCNILLQENAQLGESRAAEIAQQVAARMADKDNKFAIERMQHQQEVNRRSASRQSLPWT
jgi:hypothetical protein